MDAAVVGYTCRRQRGHTGPPLWRLSSEVLNLDGLLKNVLHVYCLVKKRCNSKVADVFCNLHFDIRD